VQKISNRLGNRRLPEYSGTAVWRGTDEVERITTAKGALSIGSRTDPMLVLTIRARHGREIVREEFLPYAVNEK